MDPFSIAMLAMMGINTAQGLFGNKQQQQTPQFPQSVKVGSKPPMTVGNPYNPIQMNNDPMQMYRPRNQLSSTLGRYGGLG